MKTEREDFSATRMMELGRPGLMVEVYDCPNTGYPARNRRTHPRGPYNERVESLFNGFENVIRNSSDHYWKGYVKEMRAEFGRLMSELNPPQK